MSTEFENLTVSLGYGRARTVGQLLRGWKLHVERIADEMAAHLEPPAGEWGVFDLVAALIIRDHVQEGIEAADPELQERLREAVAPADDRFREITEPDVTRALERATGKVPQNPHWWWVRVPSAGPIRKEINELVPEAAGWP